MAESERIAYGDHEVADLYFIRIANRQIDQVVRVDLEDRDVRGGIRTDDFGIERVIVEE